MVVLILGTKRVSNVYIENSIFLIKKYTSTHTNSRKHAYLSNNNGEDDSL